MTNLNETFHLPRPHDEDIVKKEERFQIEDFKKMRVKGGGKNLSKDIDKIVYGI